MTNWPAPGDPTPPPPIVPIPPPRRVPPGRVAMIVIMAVAVTAFITVGVVALTGGFSSKPTTFTLHGSLTLVASTNPYASDVAFGSGCHGEGGYSDLTPGAAVLVADPQGHTVGTGQLQVGNGQGASTCVMPFSVPDVPLGLASYSVTISHRGTQVESPSEAHAGVQLVIGNN